MKKISFLLSISLLLVLSACQSTINHERPIEGLKSEEAEVVITQLDRTTADYTIEEITLPKELQFPEDSSLLFELKKSEGFLFKVSVNDRLKSRMTPTLNVFDFDLSSNKIVSNPISLQVDEFRLLDFAKDENGGQYELLDFRVGENQYRRIFYNGILVEELPNNIANPFMNRGFQKLNNKIFMLSETETSNPNKSVWTIYELNKGKTEVVYQLENERFIKADEFENGTMMVIPPLQENSKDRMAFAIARDNEKFAQVFDGSELIEFQLDNYPISMIPLSDYVLFFNQVVIDELNDIVEFPLFKYDIKTKETKLIETLDYELGITYQTQGNEFYHVTADSDRSIGVCRVDDENFKCRKFEEFSSNGVVSSIETLDEKTDLVYVQDKGTFKPHLYLVHWK